MSDLFTPVHDGTDWDLEAADSPAQLLFANLLLDYLAELRYPYSSYMLEYYNSYSDRRSRADHLPSL